MRLAGLCHQAFSRGIVDDPVGQPLQLQQFDRGKRQPPVLQQRHARLAAEHQVAQVRANQPAPAGQVIEDLVELFAGKGRVIVSQAADPRSRRAWQRALALSARGLAGARHA